MCKKRHLTKLEIFFNPFSFVNRFELAWCWCCFPKAFPVILRFDCDWSTIQTANFVCKHFVDIIKSRSICVHTFAVVFKVYSSCCHRNILIEKWLTVIAFEVVLSFQKCMIRYFRNNVWLFLVCTYQIKECESEEGEKKEGRGWSDMILDDCWNWFFCFLQHNKKLIWIFQISKTN